MLYPALEPYASGLLNVGQGHHIYFETCGNPSGIPVVFLHGGPGGGCSETSRRFFDSKRYRVVLFDQRGCGRSTPHASEFPVNISQISTTLLVQDMERLREHLGIEQWLLFGGSWGCTLALAYAQKHAKQVLGMVLRGVFGAQPYELDWLYKAGGASQIFPKEWQAFTSSCSVDTALPEVTAPTALPVPNPSFPRTRESSVSTPTALLPTYDTAVQSTDASIAAPAAKAWCAWESSLSSIHADLPSAAPPSREEIQRDLAMARISAHLFVHDPLLTSGSLWQTTGQQLPYLAGIAGIIVQGQFDMVTPAATAWQLHKAWTGSELRMVHTAGHASSDPALQAALVVALDDMATLLARTGFPRSRE